MNENYVPVYAIHDEKQIKGFFGDYRFLSNFWLCDIWFEGQYYVCSENAYQAAKIESKYRHLFSAIKPGFAKKEWKNYPILDKNGDARKYDIMSAIVFDKFYRNIDLRRKLLETNNKYLEEYNTWHDSYWGVDAIKNKGENNLGKILMKIRDFWK